MTAQVRHWGHLMLRALHAAARPMAQVRRPLPSKHGSAKLPEDFHQVQLHATPAGHRTRRGRRCQSWFGTVCGVGGLRAALNSEHGCARVPAVWRPGGLCATDAAHRDRWLLTLPSRGHLYHGTCPVRPTNRGPTAERLPPDERPFGAVARGTSALHRWPDLPGTRFAGNADGGPRRLPLRVEHRTRQATHAAYAPPVSHRPSDALIQVVASVATPDSAGPELHAPAVGTTCRGWTLVERTEQQIRLLRPLPHPHRLRAVMNAPRGVRGVGVSGLCPSRGLPVAPAAKRAAVRFVARPMTLAGIHCALAGLRDAGGSYTGACIRLRARAPPPTACCRRLSFQAPDGCGAPGRVDYALLGGPIFVDEGGGLFGDEKQ